MSREGLERQLPLRTTDDIMYVANTTYMFPSFTGVGVFGFFERVNGSNPQVQFMRRIHQGDHTSNTSPTLPSAPEMPHSLMLR